jgi:hypothetical protein
MKIRECFGLINLTLPSEEFKAEPIRTLVMGLKSPYRTIYEFNYDKDDVDEALFDFINAEGLSITQKVKDFSLTTNQGKDTLFLTGGSTKQINYRIKFNLIPECPDPAFPEILVPKMKVAERA